MDKAKQKVSNAPDCCINSNIGTGNQIPYEVKKYKSHLKPRECPHCFCSSVYVNGIHHKICCNCGFQVQDIHF